MEIKIGDYVLTGTGKMVKIVGRNRDGFYGISSDGRLMPIMSWENIIENPAQYLMEHHHYDKVVELTHSIAWPEVLHKIAGEYDVWENKGKGPWKTYTVQKIQDRRTV